MDENEEFEFRHRAEQEAAAPAPMAGPATGHGPVGRRPATMDQFNPVEALFEGGMQLATGAAAGVAGGVGYGVTAGAKALGMTDADPKEVMHNIAEPMTYKPSTRSSELVERGAKSLFKKPLEKAAEVGDQAATAVGKVSPTAETFMREAPAAATAAMGVLPAAAAARPLAEAASTARTAVQGAAKATKDDVLGSLRSAGYKFRPTDVQAMKPGEKVPGVRRESLQEPAALKKNLTLENQATTTKLAAEDLGLKDKKALMEKDYEKLRDPHFKVYESVENAANLAPSTEYAYALKAAQERAGLKGNASATESISALRRNARKRARSDDVKANKEGETDMQAADDLEGALEAQLKAQGDEKLMADYKASRQSLAKIHDYEAATRGGQVDAQKVRQLDKKTPGRMSGNMKLISDAADYGSNVVRHSRGATGAGSSVKADSMVGMVKKAGGKLISKLPGMDVTRPGFQNKFGREAVGDERSSFANYGRREERPAPAGQEQSQLGTSGVDFTQTPGVVPSRSLASELELAPEPVANPQQMPQAPSMLTADTVPPVRGDIDFQASPDVSLAGELGLAPRPGDGVPYDLEYSAPGMADQMSPELSLLQDIAQQLGLSVDTPQPSLMTPVKEPVPFGPRVALEPPAGKVGKLKKPKK